MLCKCYWIVLYIMQVTAFCLGGPLYVRSVSAAIEMAIVRDVSLCIQVCMYVLQVDDGGCEFLW